MADPPAEEPVVDEPADGFYEPSAYYFLTEAPPPRPDNVDATLAAAATDSELKAELSSLVPKHQSPPSGQPISPPSYMPTRPSSLEYGAYESQLALRSSPVSACFNNEEVFVACCDEIGVNAHTVGANRVATAMTFFMVMVACCLMF